MNFQQLDKYILSKKGAKFDYPFDEKTAKELIDHSYELVYKSLTKKQRELLG